MPSALRPFFDLCFSTQFTHYRREWVSLALDIVQKRQELIASDLHAKYPAAGWEEPLDESLAKVVELDTAMLGTLLYRVQREIFCEDPLHPSLPYFAQLIKARTGMVLSCRTEIGPRFAIMHGFGTHIGPYHRIGKCLTIYQGATLGHQSTSLGEERIVVGDHCILFAGAKVSGGVTIGNHVTIAANAVLSSDAEDQSTYVGSPARKVQHH
jgi:serine acetyltransferase